ncbi:carbohydrate-binding module family 18 protein [Dothidotthia symphoricarpi CBS 119687]|uniref:Carbohydrate-binding module family 18 protein n=1 Tax=Dothidotthia symphoricarpi CBS 119687 TaxID=1392245 RepID=A0A6A6AL66_9PLEO|nr:carbohydrate-binding module family 18 protein [Dothidotthia symphoricarpi CBS 119687]KAF2132689.1 carbohydrate-binding module family 18 protein [Dothidotthia symphoricarpi CBS 119687]
MRTFFAWAFTILTTLPIIDAHSSKISPDGTCGSRKDFTCLNSRYGNCCSQYSYCGSTDAYCGRGCQAGFGQCKGVSSISHSSMISSLTSKASSSSTSCTTSSTSSLPKSSTRSKVLLSTSSTPYKAPSSTLSPTRSPILSRTSSSSSSVVQSSSLSSKLPSSSSISSSTSMPLMSSTSVLSITSSSTMATSSSTSSSSQSSSQAPSGTSTSSLPSSTSASCIPTGINYVKNSGFESGAISPWTRNSDTNYAVDVTNSATAHEGQYLVQTTVRGAGVTSMELQQPNVSISSGTQIRCSAWARSEDGVSSTVTYKMLIDGQECGTVDTLDYDWTHFGGLITVTGDTHVITVRVVMNDSDSVAYSFDDVSVTAVSGPNVCVSESPQ